MHLIQRPNRRYKRLIAISVKCSNSNRDRKLKVVAHSRKALRSGELMAKACFVRYEQGEKEDGAKVYNQRSGDSHDMIW